MPHMKSIRVSNELFLDATAEAKAMSRSIAGQIEHWIKLGQKYEATMSLNDVRSLSMVQLVGDLENIKKTYHKNFAKSVKSKVISANSGFATMSKVAKKSKVQYRDVNFD